MRAGKDRACSAIYCFVIGWLAASVVAFVATNASTKPVREVAVWDPSPPFLYSGPCAWFPFEKL